MPTIFPDNYPNHHRNNTTDHGGRKKVKKVKMNEMIRHTVDERLIFLIKRIVPGLKEGGEKEREKEEKKNFFPDIMREVGELCVLRGS